ncbi:hypothetical protein Tco_0168910, partial [Tanacetum coccineum]
PMVVEGIANMALTMWGWGLLVVMVLDAREQETRCEGDRKVRVGFWQEDIEGDKQ